VTVVDTTSGPVRGTTEGSLSVFRGIRYAAPIIGLRRWSAPEPPQAWTEPFDATSFGPAALQPTGGPMEGLVPGMGVGAIGPDCLSLNVWTPDVSGRRAVMVWIHGGSFTIGAGSLPTYNGDRLSERRDVVVVTINYRLGAIGFMSLPGRPANRGLLDQIAALEWVRDNIANFGGDPAQVTVFGESAGAGSILSLLSAPRAEGLFRRAIVASGATDLLLSADQADRVAGVVAEVAGLTLAELLDASDEVLLAAQNGAAAQLAASVGLMPFHPVLDGDLLTESWVESRVAGRHRAVELLIGTTSNEMGLFNSFDPTVDSLDDDGVIKRLARFTGHPDAVLAAYRAGGADTAPAAWREAWSDTAMWLAALAVADAHVASGGPTWMYRFDWPAAAPGLGACHGIDIPFPFEAIDREGWDGFVADPAGATGVAEQISVAWSSFARTGDPGWARFDERERLTRIFDGGTDVVSDPRGGVRTAWALR
jgi:para-nitrobenzyl esterase